MAAYGITTSPKPRGFLLPAEIIEHAAWLYDDELAPAPRTVLGNKDNRNVTREKGCVPVIPRLDQEAERTVLPEKALQASRTARTVHRKANGFKSLALRCEKTAHNYAAIAPLISTFNLGSIRP